MTSLLSDADWRKALSPHPRLYATADRFSALKAQASADPVTGQILALVLSQADRHLSAETISYAPTSSFRMSAMRTVQGRILSLSMAYRVTGDKRYLGRAREELLRLADQPEWGTDHFLDVGEAALAAGVGLDWLYDDLTPAERDRVARAIADRALTPSLRAEAGKGGWVDADFNWNPVCHGGLTAGAIAIADREPQLARRIVDRAIASLPKASVTYAPDGAYPEGPSYWSYGTTFHVFLTEALQSAFGTAYGLDTPPGFLESAGFLAQIVGPSGKDYNYSDHHERAPSEPVLLWFARKTRRREVAREEIRNLAQLSADLAASPAGSPVRPLPLSRYLPLGLLWWDPALPPAPPTSSLPRYWVAGGAQPLAILRSAWNDPSATYIALKGGTPNGSHGHMDVGSFILEADGVRWALDLGTEDYNKMRAAKLNLWSYSQNSTRWTAFRVGPEGHNLLRFDGERQHTNGKAMIVALPPDNGAPGAVADLSPLYPQVEKVTRQVRLHPDRSVSIRDEWTAGPKPLEVTWQWLTTAQVTPTPQGVRLQQGEQTLELRLEARDNRAAPTDTRVEVEDVSLPRNPQDSPNPGLKRVVVHLRTAARGTTTLTVKAIPGSARKKAAS
ncbi:MAG: heparinase II/III family protein [Cytophagales bacterium]|nr:heparinase II/III family protein [Armatimonadota bacterium]